MNYALSFFVALASGFIGGVIISFFSVSWVIVFSFFIIFFLLLVNSFFEKDEIKNKCLLVAFLFLGISCGLLRVIYFQSSLSKYLNIFENHKVVLQGKIVSSPVSNGKSQKFNFEVFDIFDYKSVSTEKIIPNNNVVVNKIKGKILVTTELFPKYKYGDVLSVSGYIKRPDKIVENDGRIFDYPNFLLKDKITHIVSFGQIKYLEKNDGNLFLKILYKIENVFVDGLANVLAEPESGLLSGIVFGSETLSKDLVEKFRTVGLSHIVVLSGYNITILAESVLFIFLFFTTNYAFLFSMISILFFVILSGAGSSSVRAGIMAIIALFGKRFGKTYSAGRALFFASLCMVVWNPMILLFDPSFHLSVIATFAIVFVSPVVLDKMKSIKNIFWNKILQKSFFKYFFGEIFATTISAQIFVLPYILYMSGKIQLLALFTNILVLPFVPTTMFLGFFTSIFGMIPISFARYFALVFGIPGYIIARYDIFIAESFSKLSFAQTGILHFSLFFMIFTYILLIYLFFFRKRKEFFIEKELRTKDGYLVVADDDF